MRNSTAEQDLNTYYKCSNISRIYVESLESARPLLDSGKIDAIAEGDIGFRSNPEDEKKYAMIDTHPLNPDQPEGENLVFWVHNAHVSWLLSPLNKILTPHQGNIYRSRFQQSA